MAINIPNALQIIFKKEAVFFFYTRRRKIASYILPT